MKVDLKISGIDGVLNTLQQLPHEVVSKQGGPVKLALAKGARLLRDEARKNMRVAIAEGGQASTGMTEQNVIAKRAKAPFGSKGERYIVTVRKRPFLNAYGIKTNPRMTANLLEYGSVHQPATPWLRPAVQAKGEQVIGVMSDDLVRRVEQVIRKLRLQNSR